MAANHLFLRSAEFARDNLLSKQKKEIEQLYNKWADDIGKKAEYYKMKTTSSSVVSEMQLRSLEKQLRASSQVLSNEISSKIKSNMRIMADSVVSSNKDWLRSLGFSEKGLDIAFSHVPTEAIQTLVSGQVYRSGWSLSSRIWGNNEETLKDIYTVVAKGRAENLSVYEIAKELQTYVTPSAQLPWNMRMKDGQKIYHRQVDYNAQRLARTLVQHTYQQSFALAARENPFITHVIWNSNGSRACELCLERDGKKFKIDDVPLDHPNGMCTLVPDVDEKMFDKLADWVNDEGRGDPEISEFAKKFGYEHKNIQKAKKDISQPASTATQKVAKGKKAEPVEGSKEWLNANFKKFEKLLNVSKEEYDKIIANISGTDLNYQKALIQASKKIQSIGQLKKYDRVTGKYIDDVGTHYSGATRSINIRLDNELIIAKRYELENGYDSLMHELGHAIDDIVGSRSKLSNSQAFKKALQNDLDTFLTMNKNGEPTDLYLKLESLFRDHNSRGVQDIVGAAKTMKKYEGLANKVETAWSHSKQYWERRDPLSEAASELFAHISSAKTNKAARKAFESYFPNSLKAFDELIAGKLKI